ncbi:hypothetical protein WA026_003143 [Henosepilachna vigintioctopunctata]|uniref:Uncharacterized protein n=1 Tax=Henosepilachna vigintioctopunctata TaxID=420089 RepID=A0AAW1TNR8_9CUCU
MAVPTYYDVDIFTKITYLISSLSEVINILGGVATKGLGGAVTRGPQAQRALEPLPLRLNFWKFLPFQNKHDGLQPDFNHDNSIERNSKVILREFPHCRKYK